MNYKNQHIIKAVSLSVVHIGCSKLSYGRDRHCLDPHKLGTEQNYRTRV